MNRAHLLYSPHVHHHASPENPASPYAPPQAQDSTMHREVPWLRDTLLLLSLQIGLSVAASATTWFTIRQPRYSQVFAAIPAGAMAFALLRRKRARMQAADYRRLLTLAGTVGWGTTSGLFLSWLKFIHASGARLPGRALVIGFGVLWGFYVVATLIGLWSGSYRGGDKPTT